MNKQLKYTWDEYVEFCKTNRIKLSQCFSSDVRYYSEHSKYIGKDYLTVEVSDYSNSIYAPKSKDNEIVFKWGEYSLTRPYARNKQMPESIDYLLEALNWYNELRAELKLNASNVAYVQMDWNNL